MRLIDADKIKLPKGFFEKIDNIPKFYEWLDTLSKVDAVEVVRFKDCKHNSLNRMIGNTYCDLGIGLCQLYDYCSYGERKEDGKTN